MHFLTVYRLRPYVMAFRR